jgi:hydroxylaminobenzene mutase
MSNNKQYADRLIFLGVLLFLFGLIIGFFIPILTNSRMGLTAHLEGIMNGMFLVLLGLIWNKLAVKEKWLKTTFWLSIYGSFANFAAVAFAAITGAGKMMPIAGGKEGTPIEEGVISFLLISLSLAMIFVCIVVLLGLYKHMKQTT